MDYNSTDGEQNEAALDAALTRALSGDRQALGEVLHHAVRASRGLACGMVGHQEAHDILQTAATKAIEKLDQFDGERSFIHWFRGIVRNACVDAQRHSARSRREFASAAEYGEDPIDGVASSEPAPFAALLSAELLQAIHEGLKELPPQGRAIIQRILYREESAESIAREECVAAATIRVRLHRARNELGARLRERGFEI